MSLKRHKSSFDEISTQLVPVEEASTKQSQEEKCSGSTEEFRDDVNVLWDYNSPQSKPKSKGRTSDKKKLKLENYIMSPRAPLRRHLSDNDKQIIKQDFCKLREEMKALKAALAKPDHETSLVISPREERFFKIDLEESPPDDFDDIMNFDPFDDNMDNQLLTFSQQIEENPINCDINGTKVKSRLEKPDVFNDSFDNAMGDFDSDILDQMTQVMDIEQAKNASDNKQTVTFYHSPGKSTQCIQSFNSELSQEKLQEIEKKRLEALAKLEAKKRLNPNRTATQENKHVPNFKCDSKSELSEEKLQEIIEKKRLEALAKLEANKKRLDPDKTVEIATFSPEKHNFPCISKDEIEKKRLEAMAKLHANKKRVEPNKPKVTDIIHCTPEDRTTKPVQTFNFDNNLQEIEKKRLEALAKLEANKRRPESNKAPESTSSSNSPLHCTPEEIEKKRLEALAKREAKRQQDIIEKKKLEALKRREESRKKMQTKIF
ncbi:unnamed protein product [Ceutorhynchus assimilis]|uniref:Uncharacterized protein n=1 Tax=Ceutorhynchus assimilis TaxID=467358 RepID=A0A9P0GRK2_9CUCU|nr:unnamed protein product [Ceutorhynchus assimilis]